MILLEGRELLGLGDPRDARVRGQRDLDDLPGAHDEPQPRRECREAGRRGDSLHERVSSFDAARKRTLELFDRVGIPDASSRLDVYPHQLSGGLKQRVMIAMALSTRPKLLIADEPTTALDVTIQAQILELMRELQRDLDMAILLITHDLGIVNELADRVAVMYAGRIWWSRAAAWTSCASCRAPLHPWLAALHAGSCRARVSRCPRSRVSFPRRRPGPRAAASRIAASACSMRCPDLELPGPTGAGLPRQHGMLVSRGRGGSAAMSLPRCRDERDVLLRVEGLRTWFPIKQGLFRHTVGWVRAVDDVSLRIEAGKTLALVGESGCGKTTAGRTILRLEEPQKGEVWFEGVDLLTLPLQAARTVRQGRSGLVRRQQDRNVRWIRAAHRHFKGIIPSATGEWAPPSTVLNLGYRNLYLATSRRMAGNRRNLGFSAFRSAW